MHDTPRLESIEVYGTPERAWSLETYSGPDIIEVKTSPTGATRITHNDGRIVYALPDKTVLTLEDGAFKTGLTAAQLFNIPRPETIT